MGGYRAPAYHRIWVKGAACLNAEKERIQQVFGAYGEIGNISTVLNGDFFFVSYLRDSDAQAAVNGVGSFEGLSVHVRPAKPEGDMMGRGGRSPPPRDHSFDDRRESGAFESYNFPRRSSGTSTEYREREDRGARDDSDRGCFEEYSEKGKYQRRGGRGGKERRRSSTTEYERGRRFDKVRAPRAVRRGGHYRDDSFEDDSRRYGSPGCQQDRKPSMRSRSRSPIRGRRRDERSRSRSPRRRSRSRSPFRPYSHAPTSQRPRSVVHARTPILPRSTTPPFPPVSTPSLPLASIVQPSPPTIGLQLSNTSNNAIDPEEEVIAGPSSSSPAQNPNQQSSTLGSPAFSADPVHSSLPSPQVSDGRFILSSFVPVEVANSIEDQVTTESRPPPSIPTMSRDLSHPTSPEAKQLAQHYLDKSSEEDPSQLEDDSEIRYQSTPSDFTEERCRIVVRNLDRSVDDHFLRGIAKDYGPVRAASAHKTCIGEGMVEFEVMADAEDALANLNGLVVNDLVMRLSRY